MKESQKKLAGLVTLALGSGAVNATDWTSVTGSLDLSGEIAAVLAIAGVMAGLAITIKGYQKVMEVMKRG